MLHLMNKTLNHKRMVVDKTILTYVAIMVYRVFVLLYVMMEFAENLLALGKSNITSSKIRLSIFIKTDIKRYMIQKRVESGV